MTAFEKQYHIEQLYRLLMEKRSLYNQMLEEDKEFEKVKIIFSEIRELEKLIREMHANNN